MFSPTACSHPSPAAIYFCTCRCASTFCFTSTASVLTRTARDSSRQWYSVASSADGSKLAAVVGDGQIYTSTDSGVTWSARDSNRFWLSVASSADGSKLVAGAYSGQIYTSVGSAGRYTLTVSEDAVAQAVPNFATNISPGPADEQAQKVSFTVTTTGDPLFEVVPFIDGTATATPGMLHFQPKANTNGTVTVTVTAKDDGGTNPGMDTSAAQTFDIKITAVNDAPRFTKGVLLCESACHQHGFSQTIFPTVRSERDLRTASWSRRFFCWA